MTDALQERDDLIAARISPADYAIQRARETLRILADVESNHQKMMRDLQKLAQRQRDDRR